MRFLVFETLEAVQQACQQIDLNMGFPDKNGTESWAIPIKAYSKDLWYIPKPPENAMNDVCLFEERENIDDLKRPNVLEKWQEAKKK